MTHRRSWRALSSLLFPLLAVLVFVAGLARQASATTLSLGTRIPIDATTFAVPIDIADGLAVVGWQFDLTYDPTDVQVNVGCDPFSGDIYCSFLTGPVTEGDFFATGAPFNLLVPGFISLDPGTGGQTGLLFGVNGIFGGAPPFPSGNGTLAFVEFTLLGTGTSPMTVSGSVNSLATVPEPATAILVVTGLAVPRIHQRFRRASRR